MDWFEDPLCDEPRARRYRPLRSQADDDTAWTIPAGHDRWRVLVQPAVTVTAGAVVVGVQVPDVDLRSRMLGGQDAQIAYATAGGAATGWCAPGEGRRIAVNLTGYAGAGQVVIALETWRSW